MKQAATKPETQMLQTKRFLKTLHGQPVDRPPFWFMRQAGRYLPEYRAVRANAGSFLDLCYNPKLAAEVTLQPIRRYGMDGAILFSDILVIPDALGQKVEFREGEGPVLEPITNRQMLAKLSDNRLHEHLAPVYETVERVRTALPSETALIGFAGAPWTVATYMVNGRGSKDHAATKDWAYSDPEGFGELIAMIVNATTAYLSQQIKAGAEIIQIFDSWAGSLSETEFDRWSIAPTRTIVKNLKAQHPTIPIIGFPKGAGALYKRYMSETGVDAISLDPGVPLDWAARVLQPQGAVQGNLDPRLTVVGGEAMLNEARRILTTLSGGAHIFNLGHGFVPQTPPEHVEALSALIRNWSA